MITYIYLIENINEDFNQVYIGKTINIDNRKYAHFRRFGHNIKINIIDQIETEQRKDWKSLERYWIEQFKQWGFTLLNQNKGGEGVDFHTEETKIKLSKPKHSIEQKEKWSLERKGRHTIWNSNKIKADKGRKKPNSFKEKINVKVNQYDLENNFIKMWNSFKEIEEKLGFKGSRIWSNIKGITKQSGGYIWKYYEN